jgi:hypothetical protein
MPSKVKGAPKRNDLSVKLEAEVVTLSRMVASARNVTIAEYLSGILRPVVKADLEREYRRLSETDVKASPKRVAATR